MGLSKNIKNSAKITNQLSLGNQTVPAEQIAIYRKTAEQNLQNSHV
jgi:hypothetical protein